MGYYGQVRAELKDIARRKISTTATTSLQRLERLPPPLTKHAVASKSLELVAELPEQCSSQQMAVSSSSALHPFDAFAESLLASPPVDTAAGSSSPIHSILKSQSHTSVQNSPLAASFADSAAESDSLKQTDAASCIWRHHATNDAEMAPQSPPPIQQLHTPSSSLSGRSTGRFSTLLVSSNRSKGNSGHGGEYGTWCGAIEKRQHQPLLRRRSAGEIKVTDDVESNGLAGNSGCLDRTVANREFAGTSARRRRAAVAAAAAVEERWGASSEADVVRVVLSG